MDVAYHHDTDYYLEEASAEATIAT